MLQAAFDALLLFPPPLAQRLLPAVKAARRGRFVFVTSARYLQPEPGFAVATSIRAATTAFALALAHENSSNDIQVNVVATNYLYTAAKPTTLVPVLLTIRMERHKLPPRYRWEGSDGRRKLVN